MSGPRTPRSHPAVLTGWGRHRADRGVGRATPSTLDVVDQAMAEAATPAPGRRGVIARGLGRSYGDAAQNAGGACPRATGSTRVLDIDLGPGQVTGEAGVSLDR